ncbi:MAG TPA: hypothetical protein VIK88_01400 [Candidatus Bathyarchaeia archaeon]
MMERVYRETPGADSFLQRTMVGKFIPYGPFTKVYFIVGPLVLILLWVVTAIL